MTRTEYLNQLEAYLMQLPQADRIEAMDYFKELFDDAGPEGEEELIASLGSPKEAAHDILTTLLDKKINEENSSKNNRQVIQIAILALLAAPIGIPVAISFLMVIICIFIAAISILLTFFAVSAAGMVLGAVLLFESFYVLAESTSAFMLIFGGGLLAIGASSLVLLATSYVTRFFGILVLRLIQWILNRGKRGESHA
ncbi:DUF1700 domain-containing protein [Streptococcus sp. V919]